MDSLENLVDNASSAEEEGDFSAAVNWLRKAVDNSPADLEIWLRLAHNYVEIENFPKAISAYNRAIELDSSLASAYSGMAVAMTYLGRLEEAERLLLRGISIESSASRYVLLGDVQCRFGRSNEAEASFRRALEVEPENEEAMYNLAVQIAETYPNKAEKLLNPSDP